MAPRRLGPAAHLAAALASACFTLPAPARAQDAAPAIAQPQPLLQQEALPPPPGSAAAAPRAPAASAPAVRPAAVQPATMPVKAPAAASGALATAPAPHPVSAPATTTAPKSAWNLYGLHLAPGSAAHPIIDPAPRPAPRPAPLEATAAPMTAPTKATEPSRAVAPVAAAEPAKPARAGTTTVDRHIADLHRKLGITPEQEAHWAPLAELMRADATHMADLMRARISKPRMTAPEDLKSYAEITEQRAQDLKKMLPAFETLYGNLSPQQQERADKLFREFGHRPAPRAKSAVAPAEAPSPPVRQAPNPAAPQS
jgi:periplasmic protein CpxP/Spy